MHFLLQKQTVSYAQEGESTGILVWNTAQGLVVPLVFLGLGRVSPRRLASVTVVSPASWRGDITCWCPTACPASRRSRTCRTPESKRVAEGSPASFCPDWRVAFPGAWCCCPLISTLWRGRPPPTCSASSSEPGCSGCLAPCRWGLCLHGHKWQRGILNNHDQN